MSQPKHINYWGLNRSLFCFSSLFYPDNNVSDYNINNAETHKWQYGIPPTGNANFAWLQHFISKLAPNGTAGVVLANGSMSSDIGSEGEIRKQLIENDLVDCMVVLPSQLFYNTQIPACLWFLARNKTNGKFRNRSGEVLFIDARKLGTMISRKQKELSDSDMLTITNTYHKWRNNDFNNLYTDIPGFCKSVNKELIAKNNYILTPGRYIDFAAVEENQWEFKSKMNELTSILKEHLQKEKELNTILKQHLKKIGYDI